VVACLHWQTFDVAERLLECGGGGLMGVGARGLGGKACEIGDRLVSLGRARVVVRQAVVDCFVPVGI